MAVISTVRVIMAVNMVVTQDLPRHSPTVLARHGHTHLPGHRDTHLGRVTG